MVFSPRFIVTVFLFASLRLQAPEAKAQDNPEVFHHISFPELNQQYVHVRSEFPVDGDSVNLRMANWNPGSYLIRDFSADLERLMILDTAGNSIDFVQNSKSSWQVNVLGQNRLVVEYDVHAGELSVNTSWVSKEYILLNNSSILLYSDASRRQAQRLSVEVPPLSGTLMTPLTATGRANEFLAASFDQLVDNPVVITDSPVFHFNVGEQAYKLVNVGAGSLWDGSQSARDLESVVRASNEFWGITPFERDYWFFNFLVERGGGLEHDHGTVIMGSRWQMRDRDDYIKWLSLAAHEFFHSWNVRRMRPVGLANYQFDREQYTGSLWLAEGLTSYYDNLLLSRANLVNPEEYLKRLAEDLHALEMTPGRLRISLQQASRDSWIKHYKQDSNSINSTISYYTKGAVLGLVLDAKLRETSRDKVSLDDVMRLMYQRWEGTPYPEDAFADAVETIGGSKVRAWFEPLLSTPAELDVDQALAWFGLQLNRSPENDVAKELGKPVISGFGVNWEKDKPALVVDSVVRGMSGSIAGLLPGDELIAINGERITRDNIDDRLKRLQPGLTVELQVFRRERLQSISLTLEEARPLKYEIKVIPEFGRRQLRHLQTWLGQPLEVVTD